MKNHPYRTAPPQHQQRWWRWVEFRILAGAVFIMASTSTLASCSWFSNPDNSNKVIKSVLDITQIACVLVHDWSDDESWISKQCDIAEDYLPEVRKLVAARKKAAAMKASMKPDAGAAHD